MGDWQMADEVVCQPSSSSADARVYVEQHLLPVLQPGLVALTRARPDNPVEWLADYLIRHKLPKHVRCSAPHMPPDRTVVVSEDARCYWNKYGGEKLEPLLKIGAVALVDARWLVQRADSDVPIVRRQELPDEAFLSLTELKASCLPIGLLPITLVSYAWLHPKHPDKRCATLKQLRPALTAMLDLIQKKRKDATLGVFWDFCSLHQHGELPRTVDEEPLFKEALKGLSSLYAHPKTWVLRVTKAPQDYPAAYGLPEGANCEVYENRGWVRAHATHACDRALR